MLNEIQELKFKVLAQVIGTRGVDDLTNSVEGLSNKSKKAKTEFNLLAEAGKFLTVALAAREIYQFTSGIFEAADVLNKMAQKTGISAHELSGLQTAAELADVSVEQLGAGLKKLAVNQVEAATGNTSLSSVFKRLSVDVKDSEGKLRSTGDVVRDLADRFASMKDGPQKTADAVKLFGKSGNDLIPFLNGGSKSLNDFKLNITDEFARGSEEFRDNLLKMKVGTQNFVLEGLKPLLPVLNEVTGAFLKTSSNTDGVSAFGLIAGESFRILAVGLNDFATIFLNAGDVIISGAKIILQTVYKAINGTLNLITDSFEVVKALGQGSKDDFYAAGKRLGKNISLGFGDAFRENDKTFKGLMDRVDSRGNNATVIRTAALKNSLLIGQGTYAEIIARQKKEQEDALKKSSPSGDNPAENDAIKDFQNKIKRINAEAGSLGISNVAREKAIFLAEVESKQIEKGSRAYNQLAVAVESALSAREFAKETQAIRDFNIAQAKDIELKFLEADAVQYSSAEYSKLVEAKKTESQIQSATKSYTQEGAQAYREAAEAVRDQKLALIDLQEEQKASYGYGARQAIKDYTEAAKNSANQMKQVFNTAFTQLEDTMVNFVKTGKLNFRSFADAVVNDLLRIAVRQAIIAPLIGAASSAFGGMGAGAATSGAGAAASSSFSPGTLSTSFSAFGNVIGPGGPMPLSKFANGGVVNSPHVAVFGEGSTAEAFVPLPDGRSIPVNMKGGGSGNSTIVNVTVNTTTGEQSSSSDSETAKQFGQSISTLIQKEIMNQQRPGGLLA